jgi:hypothetical protein
MHLEAEIEELRDSAPRVGKGGKERVLPLSPRLLQELHAYWVDQRAGKPGHDLPWLFLGAKPNQPINKGTGQNIYYRAVRLTTGLDRPGIPGSPQPRVVPPRDRWTSSVLALRAGKVSRRLPRWGMSCAPFSPRRRNASTWSGAPCGCSVCWRPVACRSWGPTFTVVAPVTNDTSLPVPVAIAIVPDAWPPRAVAGWNSSWAVSCPSPITMVSSHSLRVARPGPAQPHTPLSVAFRVRHRRVAGVRRQPPGRRSGHHRPPPYLGTATELSSPPPLSR